MVKANQEDPAQTRRKFPPLLLDYKTLLARPTRSSGKMVILQPGVPCPCQLCDIARLSLGYPAWHAAHSTPPGMSAASPPPPEPESPAVKLCRRCYAEYGPGKNHVCSRSAKQENLAALIRESSDPTISKEGENVQFSKRFPNFIYFFSHSSIFHIIPTLHMIIN